MTDAPAYLPLPKKHGEPARVGRRLAPFHSHRLASPLWTSPYVGKRKRSRCKENEACYASRLFFPDGNSVKQHAVRQGSLCGSQAATVSFRPFLLSVTHHGRICADKSKACKNAHTQRGGTGGCAPSSGSAKKSGKKPIALPGSFRIIPRQPRAISRARFHSRRPAI